MDRNGWMVAVSYLEWIRWVASGWLRCPDRLVWIEGSKDQAGMDCLMDRAPDLQAADDQGYIIACLRPGFLGVSQRIESARSSCHLFLPIEMVECFVPLSTRGARLLEADAERASVRLGEPVFEQTWADWRDRRLEEETHRRGLSFCKALGLDAPELTSVPRQIQDILAGRVPPPNAAKSRQTALEATRAFGWAAALSVAKMDEGASAALESSPLQGEAVAIIRAFKADHDIRRPLLSDETAVKLASALDELLRSNGGVDIPIAVVAAALHYKDLASAGRELALPALLEDLASLASNDPRHASLCAYSIGRSMESVAVTTLLYQSDPDCYKALTPARPAQDLNVMRRAAEKYERTISQSALDLPSTTQPTAPSCQQSDEKEAPSSALLPPREDSSSAILVDESLQEGTGKPEESVGVLVPSESEVQNPPSSEAAELVEEARAAPGLPLENDSAAPSMMSEHPPAPVESPGDSVQELPPTDLFGGDQGSSAAAVQPELKGSGKKKPRGDSRPKS